MHDSGIRLNFKKICLKQKDKLYFTPKNVGNLFIVFELVTWSQDLNTDFNLRVCKDKLRMLI